jgi:hypothetical protein
MSCGKNEQKGPTLTLDDLLGRSQTPPRPPCVRCDSGRRTKADVGLGERHGDCCPACGRLLMADGV